MSEATRGLAGARMVRPKGAAETPREIHDRELQFFFVLDGGATLACEGVHRLGSPETP